MIYKFAHLTRRGQKRQIQESCLSSTDPPIVIVADSDSKMHRRTQDEEERHDLPTTMHVIEDDHQSKNESCDSSSASEQPEEQREPIKTHRRTCATDWKELIKRTYNKSSQSKQILQHRRSMAMTNDEFMDVTMICDELHGPFESLQV